MLTEKMFITDLDGTLFRSDHTVSKNDLKTLETLGEMGVVRVLATGRSIFSLQRSLSSRLPIDYLIFSTGLGVAHYPSPFENIILKNTLTAEEARSAALVLDDLNLDYMIQRPVPDNHVFEYRYHGNGNKDFLTRIAYYKKYCAPLNNDTINFGSASQLLAIVPDKKGLIMLEAIKKRLPDHNIIKTTSPFDGKTLWIEIFPTSVSKSNAASWLSEKLQINREHVVAIGNDYNDEDLLEWAGTGYIVENGPWDMKKCFQVVASNNRNGVSEAVKKGLGIMH